MRVRFPIWTIHLVLISTALIGGWRPLLAQSTEPVQLKEGWLFRWGDSPLDTNGVPLWTTDPTTVWTPTPLPFNPSGQHQPFLWLKIPLPDTLPRHPAVGTGMVLFGFEAYLDSTRIYQNGSLTPDPTSKYLSMMPQTIPLPADAGGRMLYFRVYSPYTSFLGLPAFHGMPEPIYLSSEQLLMQSALRDRFGQLVASLTLMVVGLISLILLIKRRDTRNRKVLFYLCLYALCFGVSYTADNPYSRAVFSSPELLYYLRSTFFLFPVGALGFLIEMVGAGPRRIALHLLRVHLAFYVVAILLDLMDIVPIPVFQTVFFLVLSVSLIAMVVTVIPAMRSGKPEANIFGLGLLVVVLLGFHDTILLGFQIMPDASPVAHWGVLIFMFFLGYLVEYRFTENTRQLRTYSKDLETANLKLESYSNTLEQRVEERTQELSEKNEELATTLHRLQTAQSQLVQSEKMASLGRLTAGIAHEIKNPLNFVNNFAALSVELTDELQEELETNQDKPVADVATDLSDLLADLKFNAQKINEHGQRADNIVKGMLEHTRGTPGNRVATDVNALLDECVDLAYHGMRASNPSFNVTLEREYDESIEPITLIAQDFRRVFLNLLSNAFYAVNKKAQQSTYVPYVVLSTQSTKKGLEIQIRDNGPGIRKEAQAKIFEPFYTTKPTGEGTGLGLSLSYDIVTQGHSGTLTVESTEGEGATFIITLPR